MSLLNYELKHLNSTVEIIKGISILIIITGFFFIVIDKITSTCNQNNRCLLIAYDNSATCDKLQFIVITDYDYPISECRSIIYDYQE